jgi:rod shape-determining protein MreD
MMIDALRRLSVFIILCLAQALVLNRIHLFGCATPLLYVYFAIIFPRNYPKWAILVWCFSMGVIVDAFSNTPGVASASLTLVGILQPYLLELFLPRDVDFNVKSSVATLGFGNFASLAVFLVFIYCLVFFLLEQYSFFNWLYWLECVVGSVLLTLVLIFPIESIRK